MKSYTITVNGTVYDVTVEETGAVPAAVSSAPAAAAPAPNAAVAPAPKPAGGTGRIKVEAGAAGKVFKLETTVGAQVKKGDPILVLEIMKMETPVVAPEDGTVVSINAAVGDTVEAGALLATLD